MRAAPSTGIAINPVPSELRPKPRDFSVPAPLALAYRRQMAIGMGTAPGEEI